VAPPALEIRRLREDDWMTLRSVRLSALAESPDAFGSTLADERSNSEEEWREWVRNAAVFIAEHEGGPVGIAAGVDGDAPGAVKLVAAWVDPGHRRIGVGSALLAAVETWARAQRADALSLWVTRTNQRARDLYLRHGFVPSGTVKPLPSNPALMEDQLVLQLR
jgi:GNAT superfamily N-acetyltransferase